MGDQQPGISKPLTGKVLYIWKLSQVLDPAGKPFNWDWLAGAGGAVLLAAWALSWALEGWAAWDRLGSNQKSAVILGLAEALTVVEVWARGLPAETAAALEPYGTALVVCVVVWLETQTAHRLDPFKK